MKKLYLVATVLIVLLGVLYLGRNQLIGTTQIPTETSQEMSPTKTMISDNGVYMSKTDTAKGNYMTDEKGMTLYTYDKDATGVSNCYGGCATAWPPYTVTTAPAALPIDITAIKRTDGAIQYVYKGMPLYYYVTDTKAGEITGDGVGGVWHIIKL